MRVVFSLILLIAFTKAANAYSARAIGEDALGRSMPWYAYDVRIERDADTGALQNCMNRGLFNCRITHRWYDTCVASSVDMHRGQEHIATSRNLQQARQNAAVLCDQNSYRSGNCRPGIAFCDLIPEPDPPSIAARRVAPAEPASTVMPTPAAQLAPPEAPSSPLGQYTLMRLRPFLSEKLRPHAGAIFNFVIFTAAAALVVRLVAVFFPPEPSARPSRIAPSIHGARMQASLQHSQEHNGFYIHLTLLFTQDSINLIKARRLHDYIVIEGRTHPPYTWLTVRILVYGWYAVRIIGALAFLTSIPAAFVGFGMATHMFFGGAAAVIIGFLIPTKAIANQGVHVFTIRRFMRKPTVRLWSPDGLHVKSLDAKIREDLQTLRFALDESVTLPQSETFDV